MRRIGVTCLGVELHRLRRRAQRQRLACCRLPRPQSRLRHRPSHVPGWLAGGGTRRRAEQSQQKHAAPPQEGLASATAASSAARLMLRRTPRLAPTSVLSASSAPRLFGSSSAMTTPAAQPPWLAPLRASPPPLRVQNGLTRTKDVFQPSRPDGVVTWYNCGPTVYDASHMGHARNYVTQDILRRILRDYFGFDVHFAMNITDIDDKIILRARQQFLLAQNRAKQPTLTPALLAQVHAALDAYTLKNLAAWTTSPPHEHAPDPEAIFEAVRTAHSAHESSAARVPLAKPDGTPADAEASAKLKMHLTAVQAARDGLLSAKLVPTGSDAAELHAAAAEVLAPYLDAAEGASVTDPAIFRALAARWEAAFFHDMARLNVERPTTLTRVSEYVPEIVAFVERIVQRGFAYADTSGNVWFDVRTFDGATVDATAQAQVEGTSCEHEQCHKLRHVYAKLAPASKGDTALLAEGEGSLSVGAAQTRGKKSAADFALWKSSKPGEPSWLSPWGPGRPGWHIECSVMASAVFGPKIDIHSGGEDLKFPHHDNELAQSEAYHGTYQWINYFLHTGHLHIEGAKMSKSLKNFISVDDALAQYTPRQLRLAFLFQPWDRRMDFSSKAVDEVRRFETATDNLFRTVRARLLAAQQAAPPDPTAQAQSLDPPLSVQGNVEGADSSEITHGYTDREAVLSAALAKTQHAVRAALADNFDTPLALRQVRDLIGETNQYLDTVTKQGLHLHLPTVLAVVQWMTHFFSILGLTYPQKSETDFGWGVAPPPTSESDGSKAAPASTLDREQVAAPYVSVLSQFRDDVRALSRSADASSLPKELLALCDRLRDDGRLDELGVALEDVPSGPALVKFVPPEELRAARVAREQAAAEKVARKRAAQEAARAKQLAIWEKGRMPPEAIFRSAADAAEKYGSYDDQGIPVTDPKGEPLPKSRRKALDKEYKNQIRLHQAFLEAQKAGEI